MDTASCVAHETNKARSIFLIVLFASFYASDKKIQATADSLD